MRTNRHPVDVYVGERVRRRRSAMNMSQTELGRACNVSFQQVQKYERGDNRISMSKAWDIARALGVPLAYLVEGFDDQPPAQVDPVEDAARQHYETHRRRVRGRPAWDQLNLADPYDVGLRERAFQIAREQQHA